MSHYENAPATLMVATSCAACGRPLVDAVSVEAGMGPDCRDKHGYYEEQSSPDFEAALKMLAPLSAEDRAAFFAAQPDAHGMANKLVHRVAADSNPLVRGACIAAIGALGFIRLAHKLADHAKGICVEELGGMLVVKSPYSVEFNEAVRRVPGARWVKNPEGKGGARHVPASARVALWAALKAGYPRGTPVFGSKGTAVL